MTHFKDVLENSGKISDKFYNKLREKNLEQTQKIEDLLKTLNAGLVLAKIKSIYFGKDSLQHLSKVSITLCEELLGSRAGVQGKTFLEFSNAILAQVFLEFKLVRFSGAFPEVPQGFRII